MQSCLSSYEVSWKAFMTATPHGAISGAEAALLSALGDGAVITAPADLGAYTADTYWPALYARAAGGPLRGGALGGCARPPTPAEGGCFPPCRASPRRAPRPGRALGRWL